VIVQLGQCEILKTKDGINASKDLVEMGGRFELQP